MYNYLKNCILEAAKKALGEKEDTKGRKTFFWDAEIEKEMQNKKQLFLKWLSKKDNNEKVQYKMAEAKIKRLVTNLRNEFWYKKCLEIQSYLGIKKNSESWKFIKNILSFFRKKEKLLEKAMCNVIEIDSNTVMHAIMRI